MKESVRMNLGFLFILFRALNDSVRPIIIANMACIDRKSPIWRKIFHFAGTIPLNMSEPYIANLMYVPI